MDRKRHSQGEVEAKLRQADTLAAQGKLHKDIARALGVIIMTLHRWRKARPQMRGDVASPHGQERPSRQAERETAALIEELERENARLRVLVTDLLLEKARLEEARQTPRTGRMRQLLGACATQA